MKDFCICGQAIGPERFIKSIDLMQEAVVAHGYTGSFLLHIGDLPAGCPPHPVPNHRYHRGSDDVPYAFKAYVMKEAQEAGFRYVGYLDSVILLQQPFSVIQDVVKEHGYFFGNNGCSLARYTSDDCLTHFGMTRSEISGKHCIHGGIMFLDLEVEQCRKFLDEMYDLAYPGGPYCADWQNDRGQVSADSSVLGHRPQQSVATIVAMRLGMTNFVPYSLTYGKTKPECIFRMAHPDEIK